MPFLYNNSIANEKLILLENEVLANDSSVAKVLNSFFTNIINTMNPWIHAKWSIGGKS